MLITERTQSEQQLDLVEDCTQDCTRGFSYPI